MQEQFFCCILNCKSKFYRVVGINIWDLSICNKSWKSEFCLKEVSVYVLLSSNVHLDSHTKLPTSRFPRTSHKFQEDRTVRIKDSTKMWTSSPETQLFRLKPIFAKTTYSIGFNDTNFKFRNLLAQKLLHKGKLENSV